MPGFCRFLIIVFALFWSRPTDAQQVNLTSTEREMLTYPFFDPSPVMPLGRFYPYHRFDGFSVKGSLKGWKTVTMQNEHLKLHILPEIGGKIWGAYHLKTGFPFIYHNDVVKFRDVAARGPWTSGGVELNFGDYGHAPSCATPVDFVTRENKDGSKSTFLSTFDWSSRTYWVVEVKLDEKATYFKTNCTWHNLTPFAVSNYQWMNAGFRASDDLEFLYPGNAYIDHDGKPFSWPLSDRGRQLNFYRENNFGTYKSYHVLGETTDYFGGYWKNSDVGFIHYAPYYQKPGKKLWIWGLSRQGMIWENLLTDKNGQYVELQSGRFFNQAGPASIESPFKYNTLKPMQLDSWEEKWMYFTGIQGHTHAFEEGVLHIQDDSVRIFFHESFTGKIEMVDSLGTMVSYKRNAEAGTSIVLPGTRNLLSLLKLNEKVVYDARNEKVIKRPLTVSEPVDWQTEYGMLMRAKSLLAQRDLTGALTSLDLLLSKHPQNTEALVLKASIRIRQGKKDAEQILRRALEVNTYDGWANFYWGYFHFINRDYINAQDGFSISATQQETKQVALHYLALTAFREGQLRRAGQILVESLAHFPMTMESHYLQTVMARTTPEHKKHLSDMLEKNPLDPFALAESYIVYGEKMASERWVNEMPHQNYIEMALWYVKCGLHGDALTLLKDSPDDVMKHLWIAYLQSYTGKDPAEALRSASALSDTFVFPFRTEDFDLIAWLQQAAPAWQWHYLAGKLQWAYGLTEEARISFQNAGTPADASFFLNKALLWKDVPDTVRTCLSKAYEIDKENWRVVKAWTEFLLNEGNAAYALTVIRGYQNKHPEQYITGQVMARAMFHNQQFRQVVSYLKTLISLPNEGASGLHQLFREACLFSAVEAAKAKEGSKQIESYLTLADSYPENLGSGQPYDHDYSLTEYMRSLLKSKGNTLSWKNTIDAMDFNAYLGLASVSEKEAYLAREMYNLYVNRGK